MSPLSVEQQAIVALAHHPSLPSSTTRHWPLEGEKEEGKAWVRGEIGKKGMKETYARRMSTCLATDGIVINMVVGGEVVILKALEESSGLFIAEMPINANTQKCCGAPSLWPVEEKKSASPPSIAHEATSSVRSEHTLGHRSAQAEVTIEVLFAEE
ncbi:hypothetical protein Taro_037214 [Colocasia esculenta]|uniref:Uncharacterized protein n=1 Tax=Colocasia esculenta TaxID=4460 RepID=A0A843WC61_COLES|nr:hypothetical protein [Colocasia esculenta]